MDSLSLFKVLADGSRYAIYQLLADADEPLSTTAISTKLHLHPNTVRLHLEKMREAGLLEAEPDRHGSVGRPQYRWKAIAEVPAFGVERGGFRLLSHLLAEIAAAPQGGAGSAFDVGRRAGERRRGERNGDQLSTSARPERTPAAACLRAFVDELAGLGFDPVIDPDGDPPGDGDEQRVAVSFSRCPFRELAVLYPDLVCELHRGLSEGIASGAEVRLESFSSLVDQDPCRAEVTLGAR
ncbi:MAG TPA: helix-turn-helix domain-containing protein [Acidimicrobiales bacterium]|nr:helix-turn-helix domain-containing protein [Acidimicrobiales bacterium]